MRVVQLEKVEEVADSFEGRHYNELLAYFKISYAQLKDKISYASITLLRHETLSDDHKDLLLACRAFTHKLSKNDWINMAHPVFVGLDKVVDDETFLRVFYYLIDFMEPTDGV